MDKTCFGRFYFACTNGIKNFIIDFSLLMGYNERILKIVPEDENRLMSANTNKRVAVKWIRDRAKAAYEKKDMCHICSTTADLELHHSTSLTLLLNKWAAEMGHSLATDEDVIAIRDEFIDAHHSEIYVEVFTLCLKHHQALHRVFGKAPPLATAQKQNRWIEKQKAKALGIELPPESGVAPAKKTGSFSAFY